MGWLGKQFAACLKKANIFHAHGQVLEMQYRGQYFATIQAMPI